ncbi:hypothetical protein GCM10009854_06390 [Saccharopolyspora halophila]|uniref:Uncharacterized protein n=1 Tax=Saccharopolyspora halophila TaxID=405551 RepID=A0ABN3FMS1_9PSEU
MNEQRPVYTATISREDNMWVAVVDELPGGATDTPNFADLEVYVPDMIASLTDTEPADFTVRWRYEHGGRDLTERLANYLEWEKWCGFAAAERDQARRAAIEEMRAAGLSLRAIADVVDLSHQRIAQIAGAEPPAPEVSYPQISITAEFVQHALHAWKAQERGDAGLADREHAQAHASARQIRETNEDYRPDIAGAPSQLAVNALAALLTRALRTDADERRSFLAAVSHVLTTAAEEPGVA